MPPGHLPGQFQTIAMPRWIKFLIAVILGIALGLVYGWVVSPAEYVDIAPEALRADYRADTVLMAATIFRADGDIDAAARSLTLLGSDPPVDIASESLTYAFENNTPVSDLQLIEELVTALQTWQPAGGAP